MVKISSLAFIAICYSNLVLLSTASTVADSTDAAHSSDVPTSSVIASSPPPTVVSSPTKANFTCCGKNEVPSTVDDICGIKTCAQAINPPKFRCYAFALRNNCACKSKHYRNLAMQCVPLEVCIQQQKKQPKMPSNKKCYGKHKILIGCLNPKDYNVCPSRSSHKQCSSSNSSSRYSSSYSSALSSPFAVFVKHHKKSNLCILNVCNCKPPYLLNKCGKCVKKDKCHKKCYGLRCSGPHEYEHHGKCRCKCGYKKNKCGKCISKYQREHEQDCICLNPCSGANTIQKTYDQYSQRTCLNYLRCDQPERGKRRKIVGCDCEEGFYLLNGSCVKRSKCGKCPPSSSAPAPVSPN